jgi:thiamine pyrophosphate-dependent acetolactate synthase large subunit-like protein
MILLSGECSTDDAVQSADGISGTALVAVTSPLVIWAVQVTRSSSLPGVLLRAVRMAATMRRPVHVSVPMNVATASVEVPA